jgi:LuxR family maltose regulon positive regulatory protein
VSEPLLQTKLTVPTPRPNLVSRPLLVKRITQAVEEGNKLTLISAPAGFGKTTLLSEWIQQLDMEIGDAAEAVAFAKVAWLSLDEADDDFSRWLAYFIAALQTIAPFIGDATMSLQQSPQPGSIESLCTILINEIVAIPKPFIFVFDDYHLIRDQAIHDAVAFLLERLPQNMHLVIATRADPPLPLSRLRARGQMLELREHQLRFTAEESGTFLNERMGFGLTDHAVTALKDRTEGWIAGLQLAALSLEERADKEQFVQTFSGSHRYVLDYLAEEVWNGQPGHIQSFLLRTAILNRMTGSLCDALTGQEDGQATLERLDAANLFTIPLDDERRWYRYHQLFVDLLKKRLKEREPELMVTLHQSASRWFEREGYSGDAIRHALAAADFARAATLIEEKAETALLRSEGTTLLRWVDTLPQALVEERPLLRLYYAWAQLMGGRPIDKINLHLPSAEDVASDILAGANVLRAFVAIMQGEVARSTELSRQALAQLPPESLFFRTLATWNLSIAILAEGDLEAGLQGLAEAVQLGKETGNIMTAVMSACALAEVKLEQGRLGAAEQSYQQALEMGQDRQGRPLPVAGMTLVGLGEIARERNDLEAASAYLAQAIERLHQWGEVGALDGHIAMARVQQASGDLDGANAEIAKATLLAQKLDATEMDDILVNAHRVRLALLRGESETAVRWAAQRGLSLEVALKQLEGKRRSFDRYPFRTAECINLARLLLKQGRFEKALAFLERLSNKMVEQGRHGVNLELLNLQALALHAQGKESEAIATLAQALTVAEPEGYARLFLDEGPAMVELLQLARARRIGRGYVSRLLEMVGEGGAVPQAGRSVLLDPLSAREREVLQLLATGLSNQEIAQKLFIAKSTVRSHIKSIYSKLDVHRRWDAIQLAQELDLI